jgi:hypothetical protein
MHAVDLYKSLSRKNCGKCAQKKCMPFALSVIKGEAELSECPCLTDDQVNELQKKIVHSDWREDLILRLKGDIRDIDFGSIASHIGAELRGRALMLKCMGREYLIDPGGEITTEGFITPWIKILLLHYIKTGGRADLSGRWVSFSELKSGMVKASSFTRDCEEPLREMLDSDLQKVAQLMIRFGAETADDFPTEQAWRVLLLPRVPVVVLYWPGDAEFGSKVKILFDSTADKFLDVESIMFLAEGFVYNIEAALSRVAHA